MSNEGTTVACIGLGRMGAGIASSIQRAGFTLRVYNRTAAKMQPFADEGATAAESPKDAATGADVVVTNLMDDASVLDTVTAGDGILAGLGAGRIHIDTTTISPRCARQLAELHAEHGNRFVAGPVVGRPDVAAKGGAPDLPGGRGRGDRGVPAGRGRLHLAGNQPRGRPWPGQQHEARDQLLVGGDRRADGAGVRLRREERDQPGHVESG